MAPSPDQNPLEGVVEAWQPQGFDAHLPMQVQPLKQGLFVLQCLNAVQLHSKLDLAQRPAQQQDAGQQPVANLIASALQAQAKTRDLASRQSPAREFEQHAWVLVTLRVLAAAIQPCHGFAPTALNP